MPPARAGEESVVAERVKQLLVGTRVERAARWLRSLAPTRDAATALGRREDRLIREVLRRTLRPESNCIDVGCHLGSFLAELRRLAPHGEHMAFEPVPRKAAWLRRKFPDVAVHEVALFYKPGDTVFYEQIASSGCSGLGAPVTDDDARSYSVRCDTLDALVPPGKRVDLIKIDVEGAEADVLRGARRILGESAPLVIFECTVFGAERLGRTPGDVYDLVTAECRCAIYRIDDWLRGGPSIEREAFDRASRYPPSAYNFVAAPEGRRDHSGGGPSHSAAH